MNPQPSRFGVLVTIFYFAYAAGIVAFVFSKNTVLLKDEALFTEMQNYKDTTPQAWKIPHREFTQSEPPPHDPSDTATFDHRYYRENATMWPQPLKETPVEKQWLFSYPHTLSLLDAGQTLQLANLVGEPLWYFKTADDSEKIPGLPAVDSKLVIVTTTQGRIFALQRWSGDVVWMLPTPYEFFGRPLLKGDTLFATSFTPDSGADEFSLLAIDAASGAIKMVSNSVKHVLNTSIAGNKKGDVIVAGTKTGQVVALNGNNGDVLWAFNAESKGVGDLLVYDGLVVFADDSGQSYGLNLSTGELRWTYTLKSGTQSPFVVIPESTKGAIRTDSGYLQVIDLKTGDGHWRYNTNDPRPEQVPLLVPLSKSSAAKFKMLPQQKGWSLWSPCSENRICINNPETGQLLWRIRLKGEIASHLHMDPVNALIYALVKDEESTPPGALSMAAYTKYEAPKPVSPQPKSETQTKDPFEIDEEFD
ncbi:MAG: PQQ-like beta-propeller repeat protein [Pseudobdellovibrionaceae bacterium]|nr:PQQ-like beta-propeller repeat protein [Bdellovibrionales bacterium]USN48377.1 MAG: PQQ-like beta-propeller repeat protein [Pseudobdellovibrionaceae bacterium]